jgi:hypothetical protein
VVRSHRRIWVLMAIVGYAALDLAAFHEVIWGESALALKVFVVLTILVPLLAGLAWLTRFIDRSGQTLY